MRSMNAAYRERHREMYAHLPLVDGARVKARRLACGWTQADLLLRYNGIRDAHNPTIPRIEHNRGHLLWPSIQRLARALDCAIDDITRYPIAYGRGQRR